MKTEKKRGKNTLSILRNRNFSYSITKYLCLHLYLCDQVWNFFFLRAFLVRLRQICSRKTTIGSTYHHQLCIIREENKKKGWNENWFLCTAKQFSSGNRHLDRQKGSKMPKIWKLRFLAFLGVFGDGKCKSGIRFMIRVAILLSIRHLERLLIAKFENWVFLLSGGQNLEARVGIRVGIRFCYITNQISIFSPIKSGI